MTLYKYGFDVWISDGTPLKETTSEDGGENDSPTNTEAAFVLKSLIDSILKHSEADQDKMSIVGYLDGTRVIAHAFDEAGEGDSQGTLFADSLSKVERIMMLAPCPYLGNESDPDTLNYA